jgi:hypothetical protein
VIFRRPRGQHGTLMGNWIEERAMADITGFTRFEVVVSVTAAWLMLSCCEHHSCLSDAIVLWASRLSVWCYRGCCEHHGCLSDVIEVVVSIAAVCFCYRSCCELAAVCLCYRGCCEHRGCLSYVIEVVVSIATVGLLLSCCELAAVCLMLSRLLWALRLSVIGSWFLWE